MKIAIVGCGYVSDFYMSTLPNHRELKLVGVYDRNQQRQSAFCAFHNVTGFSSRDSLLADPTVELVLNLTNPSSHYEVSKAALAAGKHVYSEKPLAMNYEQCEELVALAKERGLSLSGAPCSVLGEAAQAAWRAIREGKIGEVRLVYAELEDGMVFKENLANWCSISGAPWPARDEFAVGCSLEHAGYYLTWLAAFFGPAVRVTSFAKRIFDDKATGQSAEEIANDLSIACIEYESGPVARITCGLVAPKDRTLRIVGDKGEITVIDAWNTRSPVCVRGEQGLSGGAVRNFQALFARIYPRSMRFGSPLQLRRAKYATPGLSSRMDFARGPAEQAQAIKENRDGRIPANLVLHINEIALVMQYADQIPQPHTLRSRFDPVAPMPWA